MAQPRNFQVWRAPSLLRMRSSLPGNHPTSSSSSFLLLVSSSYQNSLPPLSYPWQETREKHHLSTRLLSSTLTSYPATFAEPSKCPQRLVGIIWRAAERDSASSHREHHRRPTEEHNQSSIAPNTTGDTYLL